MLIPRSDSSDGVFMWQQSALAACGTEAAAIRRMRIEAARSMRRHWDHELRSLHETPGVLLIRSVCTFLSFALHELGTRERLGALTPGMLLMRSVCTFVSFALHAYMTPLLYLPLPGSNAPIVRRLLGTSNAPIASSNCLVRRLDARRLLRRLSTLVLFCMPGTLLHTTRLLHRFGTSSDIHARRLVRRLSTTANLFAKHLSSASA